MKLNKKPTTTNVTIEPKSLIKLLKANSNSLTIIEILTHFNVINDPSDMSSSKRAVLRKSRKGWTINDNSFTLNGKSYWTYIDGKTSIKVDGHHYSTGVVRLLDEKEAREQGYIK